MSKKLTLAIDASNIRQGGGVTHITQLLNSIEIEKTDFEKVIVWAPEHTLSMYPKRPWLKLESPFWINANPIIRFFMQAFFFPWLAKKYLCDVIFAPGGLISINKLLPIVTMSQNLLPFESNEMNRFGVLSKMWFKLLFLRFIQVFSFIRADGVIFLTKYAESCVKNKLPIKIDKSIVIPHGVEARFFLPNRVIEKITKYSHERPYKILYVSITMPYKHQIEVAEAAEILRNKGIPLEVMFVGPEWGWYHKKFTARINEIDPRVDYLKWLGEINFKSLHEIYAQADAFVFASSCENMPNILIEAMGSGLPIASSCMGPMPEVLGDGGLYFDPLDPESIASAIKAIAENPPAMAVMAREAVRRAEQFTWKACSENTFEFIHKCAVGEGFVSKSLL